jgi:hypothetical protein
MVSSTRNDVKQLAAQIEALAKIVQKNLDDSGDFLAAANELVANTTTMVFALGEVYATENDSGKRVRAKLNRSYVRDARGRFAKA